MPSVNRFDAVRAGWPGLVARCAALLVLLLGVSVPAAGTPSAGFCDLVDGCAQRQPMPLIKERLGDDVVRHVHDGGKFTYSCSTHGEAYGCGLSRPLSGPPLHAEPLKATEAEVLRDIQRDFTQALRQAPGRCEGAPQVRIADEGWFPYPGVDNINQAFYLWGSSAGFELRGIKALTVFYQCANHARENAVAYRMHRARRAECPGHPALSRAVDCPKLERDPQADAGTMCTDRPIPVPPVGNPIHPGTGNKFQRESDYRGAGAFGLRLERFYNSQPDVRDAGLGHQWRHSYAREVVSDGETAVVHREDGSARFFNRFVADGPWEGSPERPERLAEQTGVSGATTGWTFHRPDDSVETYDADGRLLAIRRRGGLTQTLGYVDGRLATVSDPFGRTLRFEYTGAQLSAVIDPAGGRIRYAYSDGRLRAVHYPDATPANPDDDPTRSYHYEHPDFPTHLTGITDARGVRVATWRYDALGRATGSTQAGGAERVTLAYLPGGQTRVTDALGRVSTFAFERRHGVTLLAAVDGDPCTGCATPHATVAYDANGFPRESVDANGTVTLVGRRCCGCQSVTVTRSSGVSAASVRERSSPSAS